MKPVRVRVPFLLDVVFVSAPEQIRQIEASGCVDRLHSVETRQLPGWVRFFFSATKFHDARRDLWFCPMEPASNPQYQSRRDYLWDKAAEGYQRDDVLRIAELLERDAPDLELAHAMVQIVNRRFFGEEIPRAISKAASHTLQDMGEAVWPWKYWRARKSQKQIMDHCAGRLPEKVHLLDVGHNIGEVVQTTAGALRTLHANLDTPVETLFTAHPLTPKVPRIATKSTTLDGLLGRATTPGTTVFIYKIGKAAAATGDLRFTFGTGSDDRQCVFREFFLNYMRELQVTLQERRGRLK